MYFGMKIFTKIKKRYTSYETIETPVTQKFEKFWSEAKIQLNLYFPEIIFAQFDVYFISCSITSFKDINQAFYPSGL